MRRLHINGWQRIGIVLSVIWAIVGGLWGFYAVDDAAAEYQTCLKSSTYWEPCGQALAYNYGAASNTRWYNAALFGLAPPYWLADRLCARRRGALDKGWLSR
jgi:hypothetical protein